MARDTLGLRKRLVDIIEDIELFSWDDSGAHIPPSEVEKAVDAIMELMEVSDERYRET